MTNPLKLSRFAAVVIAVAVCLAAPGGKVLAYNGHLTLVFGDMKRALSGDMGNLTESNFRDIIDGLKNNLHCNGIRVHIDPSISNPANYPQLYKDVIAYARSQGLHIYANPLGTATNPEPGGWPGKNGWINWIADYANYYQPKYLGPFNEDGQMWSATDLQDIAQGVRAKLTYSPVKIVGPDIVHVDTTISWIKDHANLPNWFDIVSSHNAGGDTSSTEWGWWKLANLAGKETWSSENPRNWSETDGGNQVGVQTVVNSAGPIAGLVFWAAYPTYVDDSGNLKNGGPALASGIGDPPNAWLTISTASPLTDGNVGLSYSQTLQAANYDAPASWSLVSGSLPAGLSLSSAGVLAGTPTTPGASSFTVLVKDDEELSTEKSFTLTVSVCSATYAITASASPASGGSITGGGTYACNASVTVRATPHAGYQFLNWKENTTVLSTSSNYTFTATADRNLVANFGGSTFTGDHAWTGGAYWLLSGGDIWSGNQSFASTVTLNLGGISQYLIVGAGGGGGGISASGTARGCGGGGGGGVQSSTAGRKLLSTSYGVTVGGGGAGGTSGGGNNGGDSAALGLTAGGGVGGYGVSVQDGGASGTPQSRSGGNLDAPADNKGGGGGGGAGAAGNNQSNGNGGAGGNGLAFSITGASVDYGGGGGGAADSSTGTPGSGGSGGGGTGSPNQSNGANGRGGGGGGGRRGDSQGFAGADGGDGVVMLRYFGGAGVTGGAQTALDAATGEQYRKFSASGTLGMPAQFITLSGNLTGNGGLTVTGPGTITLSGVNGYSGATTITSATALVTGTLGNTAVTIAHDATLIGNGILAGPVTVAGTLASGPTVGALTISNTLVLAGSAKLNFDLGASSDTVVVTGDLTLGGTLNITAAGGFGPRTYTLFRYTGTLTDNGLSIGATPNAGLLYVIDTNTLGQVNLIAGTAPQQQVTPGAGDFGVQLTGQSVVADFQVINTGDLPLTGTASTASPFRILTGSRYDLYPGATGSVTLAFSSSTPGNFAAKVIFTSNAGTTSNSLTGTVVTPFAGWQLYHFGCTNCPQAIAMANPAGDGLANLIKYALGLDPNAACVNLMIFDLVTTNGYTYLRLSTPRDPTVTDVTIEGLSTSTLTNWTTDTVIELDTDTSFRVRDAQPIETNARRFLKLRFSLP